MTAALVAAIEGLDVVVCEKAEQVGGTGATSAGTLWIPGNRPSRDAGFADSPEDAARYLGALIGDDDASGHRKAYLADGAGVIDYLTEKTDVQFVPCGLHPDYRNNVPGAASSGRAIIPQNFDGRLLGSDFDRVRPPIPEFMLMGGMMVGKLDIIGLLGRYKSVGAFRRSAGLVLRYLADRLRFRRGTRLVMGNALVARLYYSLKKRNVPVLFGARESRRRADPGGSRRRGSGFRTPPGGRVLDPGIGHKTERRLGGALSASCHGPCQAGPDRGERGGAPVRQRGRVLSRFRRGHVPVARNSQYPARLADLRDGVRHEIRSRRDSSGNPGPVATRGGGLRDGGGQPASPGGENRGGCGGIAGQRCPS